MDAAGLDSGGLLVAGDFSYASGETAARALLDGDDPPTEIIVSNEQMALATLEVARSRGLELQRDLSLISFDNTPHVSFTQTPLTTVDQPTTENSPPRAQQLPPTHN